MMHEWQLTSISSSITVMVQYLESIVLERPSAVSSAEAKMCFIITKFTSMFLHRYVQQTI